MAADIGEGGAHALRLGRGGSEVRPRQNGRELLAAEPAENTAGVQFVGQRAGEQLQHAVAETMAVGVVDLLEVVEIEHQHRERIALEVFAVPGECVDGFEQRAAVGEAGQRVGEREHALLHLLALLDDGQHHEGECDAAQKRDEDDGREPAAGVYKTHFADRHDEGERHPCQEPAGGDDQQHDRRPARHQLSASW